MRKARRWRRPTDRMRCTRRCRRSGRSSVAARPVRDRRQPGVPLIRRRACVARVRCRECRRAVDVAELNRNLRGYGASSGDAFTSATAVAIARFQSEHHVQPTGELPLGSVVFEPGAVRVTSVTPTLGSPVQPGVVLGISSTRRVVTIALDASQQTNVKVGDPVDDHAAGQLDDARSRLLRRRPSRRLRRTTRAAARARRRSRSTSPPDHPAATGRLDQAPVDVSITTARCATCSRCPSTRWSHSRAAATRSRKSRRRACAGWSASASGCSTTRPGRCRCRARDLRPGSAWWCRPS